MNMKLNLKVSCFGCGNRVPFWGENCPHCGDEKTVCQSVRIASVTSLVGGLILGAIFGGMGGFFIGGLIGLVLFAAIEQAATYLAKKRRR